MSMSRRGHARRRYTGRGPFLINATAVQNRLADRPARDGERDKDVSQADKSVSVSQRTNDHLNRNDEQMNPSISLKDCHKVD
jgi:hypothetical protein